MMRYSLIVLIIIVSLFGCKTNQIKNKVREGRWIEYYAQDSTKYKSIGRYKKGDPIKKWQYYLNGKIIKKEKYRHNICQTTFYHENGKIQSRGLTTVDTTSKYAHYYYFGDWYYYNEKGKVITLRKYNNGELVSEIEIK